MFSRPTTSRHTLTPPNTITMATPQEQLNATVASLGVAKFNVADITVSVTDIIATPDAYVTLDARSEEEMSVGMIPNSITKAEFLADPAQYKSKKVVAYCTVGYISGGCTRELRNAGHDNVYNMGDGALLGYTLAKTTAGVTKPLVKKDGSPTNEVHTFMMALAPLAGEGMVAKEFADPPAMLEAANKALAPLFVTE